MPVPDVARLTRIVAFRLFMVSAISSGIAFVAYRFFPGTAVGAYVFTFTAVLAALTLPPVVVLIVAAASRRPINEKSPRWFLYAGSLATTIGLFAIALTHDTWAIALFATGFWLLLIGAGAALTIGLLKAWS